MSVQALNRKEAIASGEDIAPVTREEYYLKGLAEGQGGGGLDYVIPEQTVTFQKYDNSNNTFAVLENVNVEGLEIEDPVILKTRVLVEGDFSDSYSIGRLQSENNIHFNNANVNYDSGQQRWEIEFTNSPPEGFEATFAAISGF